ncbi:MAG: nicotinate-nucleotide adenylyltransferase [Gemmataceae bacterium]
MQIGIFGGTFDPVHQGHLILAEQAREQGGLDEVWFLPAPRPPQKRGQIISRFDIRVEMLALALAGHAAFRIDEREKDRHGPSYTVDTLAQLRDEYPQHRFHLIIGGDSLADLPTWHDPQGVVARAGLLVMPRPGVPVLDARTLGERLGLPADRSPEVRIVQAPLIEISSRDLRQRVREQRSIRYLVPRSVEVFIRDRGLYRQAEPTESHGGTGHGCQ